MYARGPCWRTARPVEQRTRARSRAAEPVEVSGSSLSMVSSAGSSGSSPSDESRTAGTPDSTGGLLPEPEERKPEQSWNGPSSPAVASASFETVESAVSAS
jgi:hypothetical protein